MAESAPGHESSGIAVGDLLRIAAVIAVTVVAAAVLIRIATHELLKPPAAAAAASAASIPPPPRLQPDPQADLESVRAEQRARLSEWAWTDASHRYARIPIERAMQIELERQGHLPLPPPSP
ncbi:MAG: hypothetical protein ACRESY_02300 [Steroidobacteraceae bacterium]